MPFPAFVDYSKPGMEKPEDIERVHRRLAGMDQKTARSELGKIAVMQLVTRDKHGERVYPDDAALISRYPAADPKGKMSELDMAIDDRLNRIRARLQVCHGDIAEYLRGKMDVMTPELADFSKRERQCIRAARLAPTKELYDYTETLYQRNRQKYKAQIDAVDQQLQRMEYIVGLTDKEPAGLSDAEKSLHERQIQVGPHIEIPFSDLLHQQHAKLLCDDANLHSPPAALPEDLDPAQPEENAAMAANYVRGTVDQTISPIFEAAERNTNGAVNRGDLIIIDGRTVREIMEERYRELQLPESDFEAYYNKNLKNAAKDLVGAALASDQRVEMFVPNKDGFISTEPTTVTRTGFTPDPVRQPEAFGSVKKFFMKFGFFKDEAAKARAQQEEYDRTMQARARVQAKQLGIQYEKFTNTAVKDKDGFLTDGYFDSSLANAREKTANGVLPSGVDVEKLRAVVACKMLSTYGNDFPTEKLLDPQMDELSMTRQEIGRNIAAALEGADGGRQKLVDTVNGGLSKIESMLDPDVMSGDKRFTPEGQRQMLLAKIAKDAKDALGPFAADLKAETPKLNDFIELSEMTTSRGELLSAPEKTAPEQPQLTQSAPVMGRR
ncbi:MAG: hypothetical protein IJF15_02775 [Oscillospiraceae bacterium]|nr:hypothetical protein [Oscillospiraceae bacterium]